MGRCRTRRTSHLSGKGIVAYFANAHWLTEEFPRKMITTLKWDDMKVLISKKPPHENIGTMLVGVKESSRKAIAQVVNEHGWF